MLLTLSPAKKLDYEREALASDSCGTPRLMAETTQLVEKARMLKAEHLKAMMHISDDLAALNVARFKAFSTPFTDANARPAIDAFRGDVYVGLDADSLDADARQFANGHVRILSGLYGVLRPLDLMQAYRLEMGTKFDTEKGKTLYAFWGDKITNLLNEDAAAVGADVLVNLASNEYFKAVKPKLLTVPVITPVFKEVQEGIAKSVAFFAKKARGAMARYVIDQRLDCAEGLKDFAWEGYRFDSGQSNDKTWVFTRPYPGK